MCDAIDTRRWSETALQAVFSLWDFARRQAWRGSQEHAAKKLAGASAQLRPTATFNAVLAFGEYGVFSQDARYSNQIFEVSTLQLKFELHDKPPTAQEMFQAFLQSDTWVDDALGASEHGRGFPDGDKTALTPRASVMLARLLSAIQLLATRIDPGLVTKLWERLIKGAQRIADCLTRELFPNPSTSLRDTSAWEQSTVSPQIGMYAAIALHHRQLYEFLLHHSENLTALKIELEKSITKDLIEKMSTVKFEIRSYLSRQLDRQMARKHVPLDPEYDCASLIFALQGLVVLDKTIRESQYFRACVAAAVEGQRSDGCWPEGITVATHEKNGAGPLRQPSVEIALCLANCVFDPSLLFYYEARDVELLDVALPALRRQLQFLAASFQELPSGGYSGWADDRLRPGEVRMIITGTVARLVNVIRLAEIARDRAKILSRYKPKWPSVRLGQGGEKPEEYWKEVVEPDSIVRPCETLLSDFIQPLADQMRSGVYFLRPAKNGVSFILYGPPGSGKTFVVNRFASALGWPLINLNPGYFIEKGLESIEAVAGGIFADLEKLDHAVVFFDECDELFRDRSKVEEGARGILSFATASMLPKLQNLHDARKVVFILGTNLVRNIDSAIRRPGRFDALLLFDRPDGTARETIAIGAFAKARGVSTTSLPPDDLTKSKEMGKQSAGWMVEQVMAAARRAAEGKSFSSPSISDYTDWCNVEGEKELIAGGIGANVRKKILERWAAPFEVI